MNKLFEALYSLSIGEKLVLCLVFILLECILLLAIEGPPNLNPSMLKRRLASNLARKPDLSEADEKLLYAIRTSMKDELQHEQRQREQDQGDD